MPFTLIKGEFVPEAGRPDGDSIRFRPDDPDPIFRLRRRGAAPRLNATNGTIQLRFEGIDTMESKALRPFSSDATTSNLELCGVPDGTGTARGHILTNQLGPNGRPIAFVYAGDADESDGDDTVFLDSGRMRDSVNFEQLQRGHAYPLFYDTLFMDLRETMAAAAREARTRGDNVWSADVTGTGAEYSGAASVLEMQPIFPKLWRRLDKYGRDDDVSDPDRLDEFIDFLLSQRDERVLVVPESRTTGFDNVLEIDGNTIRMTVNPEDLVVVSA